MKISIRRILGKVAQHEGPHMGNYFEAAKQFYNVAHRELTF